MIERIVFTGIFLYLFLLQVWQYRFVLPYIKEHGRSNLYAQSVKSAWTLSLFIVALIFLFGVPPRELGIALAPKPGGENVFTLSLVILTGLTVLYLSLVTSHRLRLRARRWYATDVEQAMLPHTREEWSGWKAVSWTAGVTEEFLFRAVFVYTIGLYVDAAPWVLALVSGLLFGAAHLYQGWRGVVVTGAIGAGLTFLYVGSGVIWPVMLIHVVFDLLAGPVYVVSEENE